MIHWKKLPIILLLFVLSSVVFLFKDKTIKVSDAILTKFSLLGESVNYIANIDKSVGDFLSNSAHNIQLKQENFLLEHRLGQLKNIEIENKKLKSLLNFVGEYHAEYLSAKVVNRIIDPYIHNIIGLIGEGDGVRAGQPVINYQGLVGKVLSVADKTSRILLLTDINCRVPVKTAKSEKYGILSGANSDYLDIIYIDAVSDIIVGEEVLTTSDGGYFPDSIIVGHVVSVKDKIAKVKPVIDFNKLDYVLILHMQ